MTPYVNSYGAIYICHHLCRLSMFSTQGKSPHGAICNSHMTQISLHMVKKCHMCQHMAQLSGTILRPICNFSALYVNLTYVTITRLPAHRKILLKMMGRQNHGAPKSIFRWRAKSILQRCAKNIQLREHNCGTNLQIILN